MFERFLRSKQHNTHFLNRYIKFINWCKENPTINKYYEMHHICPKSIDMFPTFSKEDWNIIKLSARQHFIAHWLLYKSYPTSRKQLYAFLCMADKQSRNNKRDAIKLSSRLYEKYRKINNKRIAEERKGKAYYKDKNGEIVYCKTTDPRVLSGELTSLTKGRSSGVRSEKWKKKHAAKLREIKRNPNKKKKLYFLDIQIEVSFYSEKFILLLEQGWSTKCTKEYRSKISTQSNKSRSSIVYKRIAEKNRKIKGTESRKHTIERRLKCRTDYAKKYLYIKEQNKIVYADPLQCEYDGIKFIYVFSREKGFKFIWDKDGKRKPLHPEVPLPAGYFSVYPLVEKYIYSRKNNTISQKMIRDAEKNDIIIKAPNGNRVKIVLDNGNTLYITKDFINEFGLPKNASLITKRKDH